MTLNNDDPSCEFTKELGDLGPLRNIRISSSNPNLLNQFFTDVVKYEEGIMVITPLGTLGMGNPPKEMAKEWYQRLLQFPTNPERYQSSLKHAENLGTFFGVDTAIRMRRLRLRERIAGLFDRRVYELEGPTQEEIGLLGIFPPHQEVYERQIDIAYRKGEQRIWNLLVGKTNLKGRLLKVIGFYP